MQTKDGFKLDHPLPLFLSDEPEQQGTGKAWDEAVILSRVLKVSVVVAMATAIGVAILSVGNPATLFADVTASLVDKSAVQPGTDQSTPKIQSTADAQASPPTPKEAPTRDEINATPESAAQSQMENSGPSSEVLFRQFRAWAAENSEHAWVEPAQSVQDAPAQVVKNAPAQVAENARAPVRLMQDRHVRPIQSARAEIRPMQNPRKKVQREQNARAQVPPAQDARAEGQSVQNTQAPSFLQNFGWRN